MGVFTFESESTGAIPPAKFFKAHVLEGHKLLPKAVPQAVKSIEILEGDGGSAGSVLKVNFGEASPTFKHAIHKMEFVDKDKFLLNYSIIGGDVLGDNIEKISYETKVVASPDGGSIWKSKGAYHTKGDYVIEEDKIKEADEKGKQLFKAAHEYVLAHPNEF